MRGRALCFVFDMKWEITYRGVDGALCTVIVAAADRQELFKELSARGIYAVKVKENTVQKSRSVKHWMFSRVLRWIGATALLFVCIVILVRFLLQPKGTEPRVSFSKKEQAQTTALPDRQPNQIQNTKDAPLNAAEKPLTERERRIAEIKKKIKDNPQRMPDTNSVFKTSLEQTLALMFTTELGKPPFPFPPLSTKDRERITEILISNNPVTEYDSDMVVFQKETVEQVKKEMRKFIKDGGDPQKFIDYYQNELRVAAQERSLAVTESRKIMKESPELYKDFVETVNARFAEKGIKQIPLLPLTDE